MINSIETKDYMSDNPVCFTADMDIYEAIHLLLLHKVSGGNVLNENNEVIGILSELDCLKAIIHASFYSEGGGCVGDFMTTANIETMAINTSLIDAAQLLLNNKRRRMPIVHEGKFVGQISARSILRALSDSRETKSSRTA